MAQLKTNNIKKLRNLIIFLILIFVIFLFFLNFKHSYTLKYKINDIDVTEKYHKKEKYYSFLISYKGKDYEVISFDKYTSKRKLIRDIKVNKLDENTCLSFESSKTIFIYSSSVLKILPLRPSITVFLKLSSSMQIGATLAAIASITVSPWVSVVEAVAKTSAIL